MKNLYQVIFVDEYNNNYMLGFFKELDNCIEDINGYLTTYGERYVLEKGDIKLYASTFGECFDIELGHLFVSKSDNLNDDTPYDDLQSCMVRGFTFAFDDEDYDTAVKLLGAR